MVSKSNTPLLKVLNLSLIFSSRPDVKVLGDLSFSIDSGETLALVGESGSGKSLTALSISRLLPHGARIIGGSVNLDNVDLFGLTEFEMMRYRGNKVGMIFQEAQAALNPVISVGQQIEESIRVNDKKISKNKIRTDAIQLMNSVGIKDSAERFFDYPHQFSGGMRQRVIIAIALAAKPKLLIADEPTTSLDVTVQKKILNVIKKIQRRESSALLFITHDLAVACEIADKILVMKEGKIVEHGTVEDFIKNPSHEYTKKLMESLPSWSRRVAEGRAKNVRSFEETLEVQNLKVWYPIKRGFLKRVKGYVKAVDGVSFSIKKGKTLALVGESGSGKTTIGKGILRLTDIQSGSIKYKGLEITSVSQHQLRDYRKKVQVIFQDPYLSMNPRMTVHEIVQEGMEIQRIAKNRNDINRRVNEVLDLVGIAIKDKYRFPHQFSGGQRQRICIARALAVEPELIVCDEPTSSLDVSVQYQILSLLLLLQREKKLSYLFITHNIEVVAYIADEIAVLKNGRLVEIGEVSALLKSPQHQYTRSLLDSVPTLPDSA